MSLVSLIGEKLINKYRLFELAPGRVRIGRRIGYTSIRGNKWDKELNCVVFQGLNSGGDGTIAELTKKKFPRR